MEEARKLFPEHGSLEWTDLIVDGRVKKGEAPDPDRIPPEVCKIYARECERTSSQRVEGGTTGVDRETKKQGEKAKYKPICLLNGMGKLYEGMLIEKLRKDVQRPGDLAETQYGFRADGCI